MHVGTQRTGIGEEALVRKDNGSFLNWNVSDVGRGEVDPEAQKEGNLIKLQKRNWQEVCKG